MIKRLMHIAIPAETYLIHIDFVTFSILLLYFLVFNRIFLSIYSYIFANFFFIIILLQKKNIHMSYVNHFL